jgi:glycosyltransferase involved in cell wall biosynthesis
LKSTSKQSTGEKRKLAFVYWFTFYNLSSPTVRYRGKYTVNYLASQYGIGSIFIVPGYSANTIFRFLRAWLSALLFPRKNSIIIIQSVYTKSVYATALKLLVVCRKRRCWFDMDDADYLRYPPETIYYFLKNCSTVSLGSTELVKNLLKYNANCRLIPCPTPDLKIVKHSKNKMLTIGWIGDFTKGHKQSLMESFFPALTHLPFPVKLVMLGVERKEEYDFLTEYLHNFKNVLTEIEQGIDWQNELDLQNRIATFDIGIATLLDNEFYRSKSAFKLKQCFNNGVPVLSSDIPENNIFIEHGINGYLCSTPSDFRQRIIEFHEMDEKTYQLFSTHARASIHKFSLKNFCDTLLRIYSSQNSGKPD